MTSTTQQIMALATMEGTYAIIDKYGLDAEEVSGVFHKAYSAVMEHAADGDGICLRIECENQVSPMSSIICSDHLTEMSL